MSQDKDTTEEGPSKIKKTYDFRPARISLEVSNVRLTKIQSTIFYCVPQASQEV